MDNLLTSLDPMLLFKNLEKRKAIRESTEVIENVKEPLANTLVRQLHPQIQHMVISEVKKREGAATFRLVPDLEKGTKECAPFLPGQYVSVYVNIGGTKTSRAYSLSSSPLEAENGLYEITVKEAPGGFVSSYILSSWREGTKVTISGPQGHFYYNPIRDKAPLICIAGGSGITPFMSFIKAMGDKTPISLIYGSRKKDETLFFDEIEEMDKLYPLFKSVFVFSDEERKGYEHGFITSSIIKKYMPDKNSSVFICGPEKMLEFVDKELFVMGIEKRRIRHDSLSFSFHPEWERKNIKVKVISGGKETIISASSDETLLVALERGGVKAPSSCRSGECGFCRSLLRKGDVYIPEELDKRRRKDKDYAYIHPCVTYAVGDVEIEIFPPAGLYKED